MWLVMDQYSPPAPPERTAAMAAAGASTGFTNLAMSPGYPAPMSGFPPAPGFRPTAGFPPQWYGQPVPAMAPMRPVEAVSGGAGMSAMNTRIAWFAGGGVLLLIAVIALGLTRNGTQDRNLVELAVDGVATLRDLALYVLGLIPR